MSIKKAKVVIIGSGAMGSSVAYYLNQKGFTEIVVLEKSSLLGGHSSCHCAGGIRHQFSSETNVKLTMLNLKLWRQFQDTHSCNFQSIPTGYLFALTENDDPKPFQEAMMIQNELGIDVRWVSPSDIRKMIPQMKCSDIIGGTFCREDGLIDAGMVMNSYITECQKSGVQFYPNVEVVGFTIRQGIITGIATNNGNMPADIVINAAGPWASQIFEMAGIRLPICPIHEQLIVTEDLEWIHEKIPVVIFPGNGLGLHIEGNGLLFGLHKESAWGQGCKMGIDIQNEISACQMLCARIPEIETVTLKSAWYGFYDTTPDNNPIIGKIDDINGLYALTGFSGHGFMHSAAAGFLLSKLIADEDKSNPITAGMDITAKELEVYSFGRFKGIKPNMAELYKI